MRLRLSFVVLRLFLLLVKSGICWWNRFLTRISRGCAVLERFLREVVVCILLQFLFFIAVAILVILFYFFFIRVALFITIVLALVWVATFFFLLRVNRLLLLLLLLRSKVLRTIRLLVFCHFSESVLIDYFLHCDYFLLFGGLVAAPTPEGLNNIHN